LIIAHNNNPRQTLTDMTDKDIRLEIRGQVAVVRLTRAAKRNALSDALVLALRDTFQQLPGTVRAAVIDGEGEHFCAGLDLSELKERDAGAGMHHSRMWHAALEEVQYGPVPVVAALHGAVVGGGLELAAACHIRVADETAFYALPEGSRGIFVGGGGAVRIPRLIGVARMTDMMLTGRVYDAKEGERAGFAQYLVPAGKAFDKAMELAERIAQNAPLTNYALMHALPRIAEQPADQGYLTEALMSAIAQSAPEAKQRVRAFLEGKAAKVGRN
jgi:enoyl-CoA hydratase/carnithine racemase